MQQLNLTKGILDVVGCILMVQSKGNSRHLELLGVLHLQFSSLFI